MNSRLFQRDFTIMILGQIISLFGNAILRFSLSLHVLEVTGSAAVFGTILAVSMIPTVLLSPFGGVLADRLPKQKIMTILDFVTAGLIVFYDAVYGSAGNLAAVTIFMILLTLIQAFYQPSVQASIPLLASKEQLMAANGIVMQVQALAGLLGPILAGILYGIGGVKPILAASAVCFFLSAVMELFLRIPHEKREADGSPVRMALLDIKGAVIYLIRENTCLFKLLIVVAGINLFLSALFIIGLPYLVKIYLGMSAQAYGFAEAAMGMGSILGGLVSGLAGKKIPFKHSHYFLLGTPLLLIPVILILLFQAPGKMIYAVLLFSVMIGMGFAALFTIAAQTFIQKSTPVHMLGKVGAFVSTICVCALPIGQAMYGGLFELFSGSPWVVVLVGTVISMMLAYAAKRTLRNAEA
ncbi:putative MFS family arabinose efflux permease [Hungatella effluvii]|uniref:Putative MFS family arabinose efflux permease n=1 Tax=Hungatella effluvii TaxID=1096246 RepID=A0A2V3Y164_9FIRM|nr:MFS transporter [Hungatella effluvii]PXX50150.1 putative MFS family arabinose efflux permease [Hungatella effluvii]